MRNVILTAILSNYNFDLGSPC